MEQEKYLLTKVLLCEMLPHGVICNCVDPNFSGSVDWTLYAINLQDDTIQATNGEWTDEFDIEKVKPYLRPMSSMTEEEAKEIAILHDIKEKDILSVKVKSDYIDVIVDDGFCSTERITIWYDEIVSSIKCFDWLNKKMFDYRGLIPMGLALEAPEGMYKEE